ncbi:MAG: hypothetical protein U5K69_27480 [Balneolaceae bacterium]|nr:hypothetical protein [Balneolaceae bacterium]
MHSRLACSTTAVFYDTLWVNQDSEGFPQVDGFYQFEPDRSRYPAYHFRMSAYDLALYGTLFL